MTTRSGSSGGNRDDGKRGSGGSKGPRTGRKTSSSRSGSGTSKSGPAGRSGKPGGAGKQRAGSSGRSSDRNRDDRDKKPGGRNKRDDRPRRDSGSGRDGRSDGPARVGPAKWGGVARRGAVKVQEEPFDDSVEFSDEEKAAYAKRQARRDALEARQQELRDEAREAVERSGSKYTSKGKKSARTPKPLERRPLDEIPIRQIDPERALKVAMGDGPGEKGLKDLYRASDAFESDRYRDAIGLLRPLVERAPEVAELRELLGLSYYRTGKWKEAAKELERFRSITGTAEQHPPLADCYRALGRWADVDELWTELRQASPSASLVTEGRIVVAGALADRGDLQSAIQLLERKWKRPKRAYEHHLSRAYALADLYERAGDGPRAAELFGWVARQAPDFSDAAERAER